MEKINLAQKMICRSLYCQKCAKAERPTGNEIIALYRKSVQGYKILYPNEYTIPQNSDEYRKEIGLTPPSHV